MSQLGSRYIPIRTTILSPSDILLSADFSHPTDLGAHLVSLDVTAKQSCQDAVDKVLAEQGRIDILINK